MNEELTIAQTRDANFAQAAAASIVELKSLTKEAKIIADTTVINNLLKMLEERTNLFFFPSLAERSETVLVSAKFLTER